MFEKFVTKLTRWTGSTAAVIGFAVVVFVWLLTGPILNFSDTWQLIINTATTISTGWLVFIIQASQNKSDDATHTKLDAILKYLESNKADIAIGIEDLPDEEIRKLHERLKGIGPDQASRRVQEADAK